MIQVDGGEGGIRTHEGRKPLPVFKTGAFNRSATSPLQKALIFQELTERPVFVNTLRVHRFRIFRM